MSIFKVTLYFYRVYSAPVWLST